LTANLSSKLESLLKTMSEGDDYARHGFELLVKRPDPERYFDALAGAGFFDASCNPGPAPANEPGFVHIPFWTPLNYLEAVAKRSGELNDVELANNVLDVVRAVTNYRDPDGSIRDNYSTYWKFAEILGLVPLRAITTADINLAATWIKSKFDKGLVGRALGATVLSRLLASSDPSDIEKACRLMKQCMSFEWLEKDPRGREIATAIDDYWLKEIIKKNAKLLGAKAGLRAATIFSDGLKAIFTDERRPYGSTLWRPAIEDNEQNLDFRSTENRFVEGLRDVLAGWMEVDANSASQFVKDALHSGIEIMRRIAIHAVTEHFEVLRDIFEASISPDLFVSGLRHELYRLLKERFSNFSETGKAAVINAMRALPVPTKGEELEIRLKRTQREWLTAIKDYPEATAWFAELSNDPSLGLPSDHPDFLSYHEMRYGPGPAPFGAESLISFAEDGSIVDRLNEFKEKDSWSGPTLGGLISALEGAVATSPNTFLRILSSFHGAKLPFQHAVLSGFKRLFDPSNESKPEFNWDVAWPKLITYFLECINDQAFWAYTPEENVNLIPTRTWMTTLIAGFLEAGTKNDETAYSPDLLPQGWQIITSLLPRVAEEKASLTDPMTHALNTEKGRLVGAMFNHALRVCRIAKQKNESVANAWDSVRGAFDGEIAKCRDSNFEFSTLSAAYIANLDFMSRDWLKANVKEIFPIGYPTNFKAAVGGLAYATPTRPIYQMLSEIGFFENALKQKTQDSHSRERIIEWISLAYLWADENLDSTLLTKIFAGGANDLQIVAGFFWRVRGDKLTSDQVEKILAFWSKSIAWSKTQKVVPVNFLARLSRLTPYLKTLDERASGLLLEVVPHVHSDYSTDQMVKELARLVDTNPAATAEILERMLQANAPNYDTDDKLKGLIQKLAMLGFRAEAIRCTEILRKSLPGMLELYKQLVAAN
jgi:hypothetical protein